MRVALPLDEVARLSRRRRVRTFEPGRDEAAWLEVNNRAFANHPEQGGWIKGDARPAHGRAVVRPERFLLAFDGDGLAGFNWLKVQKHDGRDPRLGEIFVIGVDPGRQGRGLGRALAVEGLAPLASDGITTGMLFVAAENTRRRALRLRTGFAVHRADRAYERMVRHDENRTPNDSPATARRARSSTSCSPASASPRTAARNSGTGSGRSGARSRSSRTSRRRCANGSRPRCRSRSTS